MSRPIIQENARSGYRPSADKDYQWWTQEDPSAAVADVVTRLLQQLRPLQYQRTLHARLYADRALWSYFYATGLGVPLAIPQIPAAYAGYNVIRSIADTLAAKITKQKVRPVYLTDDGDWYEQQSAKKLSAVVEASFYDSGFYQQAAQAFRHATVFDTGCLKVLPNDKGGVKIETVLISEILVDSVEASVGAVRQLHQAKYIPREQLLSLYPDNAATIEGTPAVVTSSANTITDPIRVVESWRLGTKESPGRHCLTLDNCVLFDEEYPYDYFPFVFFRYSAPLLGFYGQSLVEELMPVQLDIYRTQRDITKSQMLLAVPRVLVDVTSNVVDDHIVDEIGSIIKYSGTPPQFITPTAQNPEMYNHLKWLIQTAYESSGVSQLSAGSKKPAGLDSGVALREYSDIESERFATLSLAWEQFAIDAAKLIVQIGVDHKLKRFAGIKSAKLDSLKIKVWPSNLLPQSPAGRVQRVIELVQAGFIPQDQAMSLLDFPDVAEFVSLDTASLKLTKKNLSDMLETGVYEAPEPQQNLKQALQLAQQAFLNAKSENAPDERLELLLRYQDDCERLLQLLVPEPQASNPQVTAPLAVPEPLPISDMVPQIV